MTDATPEGMANYWKQQAEHLQTSLEAMARQLEEMKRELEQEKVIIEVAQGANAKLAQDLKIARAHIQRLVTDSDYAGTLTEEVA